MSRFNLVCVDFLVAFMLAVFSVDGGPIKRSAHHNYDELGRPLGYDHLGSQGFGGYGGQGDLRSGHRDLINHHEDLVRHEDSRVNPRAFGGHRDLVHQGDMMGGHGEYPFGGDSVGLEDVTIDVVLGPSAFGGHKDLVHQGDLMRDHGKYPFGGYGVGGLGDGFVPDGHHV